MSNYLTHTFQLKDLNNGKSIIAAGGVVQVCTAGSPANATLFDPDNNFASLAQPVAISNGQVRFAVEVAVLTVDLYIRAPGGQFLVFAGAVAQELNEIGLDLRNPFQMYKVPYSFADSTAATEKDTGIEIPDKALVSPHCAVLVTAIDATETIDLGILASETGGDANGFAALAPIGVLGLIPLQSATTATRGALIGGGTLDFGHVGDGVAKTISYTMTAGSDTGEGFAMIPVQLEAAG